MQQYQKYYVRDRDQIFGFTGILLAESSSRVGFRPRWVEFKLYRTFKGVYVLSRVGVSLLFHNEECEVVSRNHLSSAAEQDVPGAYVACPDCKPVRIGTESIYPETPRYWALHTDDPQKIVDNLKKYDKDGIGYLTHVASRLLVSASRNDEKIDNAFSVVEIE
jgi:hypothetical protein